MTPARRLLRLEAVEDRCLPSGFRPPPGPPALPAGGPDRYDFRHRDDYARGDQPKSQDEWLVVMPMPVVLVRLTAADGPPTAEPVATRQQPADTAVAAADRPAFARLAAPVAVVEAVPPEAEPAVAAEPPRGMRAVATPGRLVSAVVAEPPATRSVVATPPGDRTRVAPPADSTPTPAPVAAPSGVTPPAREPVAVAPAPPAAAVSASTPLTVLPADPPTDPPAGVPEAVTPAPPPTADLPPVAAVAQGLFAAVAPPLVPLVGALPVDLAAVEEAAAGLLAQLAADPADGGAAGRWGWLGAAVLAAGGLAHALRPTADRRPAPPGADSALARLESRHARR